MSSLAWLDTSSDDQRRALDAISLFAEQDTRDELGIGTIRDAFADQLFPGTSTIQTRARYFFFVPWIYLRHEESGTLPEKINALARKDELALIEALLQSGDTDGVIGKQARARLQRLPSNIYWQGLGLLGLRRYMGSQEQYHRSLSRFYNLQDARPQTDPGEPPPEALPTNWHPRIPAPPQGFPKQADLRLTEAEADFLRERIMTGAPGTLFAFLVDRGRLGEPVEFPWEHPQYGSFPSAARELLEHARNFSDVIYGAALLYNLMLSEMLKSNDRVEEYRDALEVWAGGLDERRSILAGWDIKRFWGLAAGGGGRITIPTRLFIDNWIQLALSPNVATRVAGHDGARSLVHERERFLKRGLARLDNRRALDLWGGASGTRPLNYRWSIAQSIVTDILSGLRGKSGHA